MLRQVSPQTANRRGGDTVPHTEPALACERGELLLRRGAIEEAIVEFRAALTLQSGNVRSLSGFATAWELLGRPEDAVDAWCLLGEAYEREHRYVEARQAYDRALAIKPTCLKALVKQGWLHITFANPSRALQSLRAAVALAPEHRWARLGISWASWLLEDPDTAEREFDWFLRYGPWPRRQFEQPVWDGSPLRGKTLLLWTDAGLGDVLQALRYLAWTRASVDRVIVECDRNLMALVSATESVDLVVARNTPLPHFDLHAPLAGLSKILKAHDTAASSPPYVRLRSADASKWRQRLSLSGHQTIGLAWRTAPNGMLASLRCASLSDFAPLSNLPNARFVSLQIGPGAAAALNQSEGMEIEQVLHESCTVAETAAAVANLDLVITVDTMLAHLAGALGKPVWTLVPYSPDPRWGLRGDTTPLYPTMRLWRQTRLGDWLGVLQRIRAALKEARAWPSEISCRSERH